MSHVLLLISNPLARAVTRPVRETAAGAAGARADGFTELSEDVAYELALTASPGDIAGAVSAALQGAPLDIAVIPAAGRRKALFLADMDSTMIEQECIDEIGALKGLREPIAAVTERAMRGEIAFEQALRERVALLEGIGRAELDRLASERLTLTPGGRTAVRTMRAHGTHCVLVSGGFTVFTGTIAGRIGFDEHRANTLLFDGNRLTGTVAEPILGQDAKRDALVSVAAARGIPLSATLAIGDGANDLAMIAAAGLGVAFRAKPVVAAQADVRIEHGDLTALLYLQGYREAEFTGG